MVGGWLNGAPWSISHSVNIKAGDAGRFAVI